jgi:tRNA(Ile)-lysidine synthase
VLKQVQATIERHNMLPPGSRVIAAVSGGPDSVCLLHALRELGYKVAGVAHFNHKLRGDASDKDEDFVSKLAYSLELPFYCASAPIGSIAGNLEQNARRARRQFFRELLAAGHGTRIALGQTRDDQAETVLFRLLRGSGPSGLAGILPLTAEGLVRPLLDIRRSDVLDYLRERGLAWREDETNQSPLFARNRIRQSLLPHLAAEWNPSIVGALAQLADVAYEEERYWESEVTRLAGSVAKVDEGAVEVCVHRLSSLGRAGLRRLIRHLIRAAKGNLNGVEYDHVEGIAALATSETGSGRLALPGAWAIRSFDWLLIAARHFRGSQINPVRVEAPGRYQLDHSKQLIYIELSNGSEVGGPCDTLEASLTGLELRGWRPGDRYKPVGRSRETKLKELFQEARVPSWRRSAWPILTGNGKILWAKEFGPAAGLSVLRVREIPLVV